MKKATFRMGRKAIVGQSKFYLIVLLLKNGKSFLVVEALSKKDSSTRLHYLHSLRLTFGQYPFIFDRHY